MGVRLLCDCGQIYSLVDTVCKMGGGQRDQYPIATYHLYRCQCGSTHWVKS